MRLFVTLIIIILASTEAFAEISNADWKEYGEIIEGYQPPYTQHVLSKLKVCSAKGNIACTGGVGSALYDQNKFHEAFPYLLEASSEGVPVVDGTLASMYVSGVGVVEDISKAISYGEKAAKKGDVYGLYIVALAHNNEALRYSPSSREYLKKITEAYAWGKVTLSFSEELRNRLEQNFISEFSANHSHLQDLLASKGKLAGANQKAIDICESITGCYI